MAMCSEKSTRSLKKDSDGSSPKSGQRFARGSNLKCTAKMQYHFNASTDSCPSRSSKRNRSSNNRIPNGPPRKTPL